MIYDLISKIKIIIILLLLILIIIIYKNNNKIFEKFSSCPPLYTTVTLTITSGATSVTSGVSTNITVTFSNAQVPTPTVSANDFSTTTALTPSPTDTTNKIFNFNWTPNTYMSGFTFTGLSCVGTPLSTLFIYLPNTITIHSACTSVITVSSTSNVYTTQSNTITVNFSCVQTSTPTIVGTSPTNGTIDPLTLTPLSPQASSGSSYTFSWNPTNTTVTNFSFDNVDGYVNTPVSSTIGITPIQPPKPGSCSIPPSVITVSSTSNVYTTQSNTITVNFSCVQTSTPTIVGTSPTNGTIVPLTLIPLSPPASSGSSYHLVGTPQI